MLTRKFFLFIAIVLIPLVLVGATRRDIRVLSYAISGIDTSTARIPEWAMNLFIEFAQYSVSADLRCVERIDTIPLSYDSVQYDLPGDMVLNGVKEVVHKNSDDNKFKGLVYTDINNVSKMSKATLEYYALWNNRIIFNAVNTSDTTDTVFLKYAKKARELTEDTMVSDVPDEYIEMVVYKVIEKMYFNRKEATLLSSTVGLYNAILQLRIQLYEVRSSEPITVPDEPQ